MCARAECIVGNDDSAARPHTVPPGLSQLLSKVGSLSTKTSSSDITERKRSTKETKRKERKGKERHKHKGHKSSMTEKVAKKGTRGLLGQAVGCSTETY